MPDEAPAIDLAELRRLAEAWRDGTALIYSGRTRLDAETFLALLDRLASAEEALAAIEKSEHCSIWAVQTARAHFARHKETGDAR